MFVEQTSMTIDEIGSSTIILLPSCDTSGNCYVSEIDVTSDAGQVIMNQTFRQQSWKHRQ